MRIPRLVATLLLILGALVLTGNAAPSAAATWTPAPVPSGTQSWLAPCATDSSLDCIESVGAVINGSDVKGTLTGRTGNSNTGGICCHEWRIPGLVNEDGLDLVETQLRLTGDNVSVSPCSSKCLVGFQGDIYATSQNGFRPQWESKLDTCAANNGRVNGVCSRFGNLQQGVTFFMVLRSSWVLPSIVSAKSSEPVVTTEKLATSGASRVRIQGIPHRILGVDPSQMTTYFTDPKGFGAWTTRSFAFHLLDGRQFGYYGECVEKATLVMGDNTKGATPPTFDKSTGALDLKVVNPHFDTDRTTVYTGAYQARIPQETAQCLWGPKITSTKQFKVSVIEDSTGSSKVSTTSITSDGSIFRIDASGFTFSSPTIRVTADESLNSTVTPVVAKPARPTVVSMVIARGSVTVVLKRVSGVSHTVTVTSGSLRKTLSCRSATSRVTCTAKSLRKGSWKLSIVPRNSAGTGTAYTKSLRVS